MEADEYIDKLEKQVGERDTRITILQQENFDLANENESLKKQIETLKEDITFLENQLKKAEV